MTIGNKLVQIREKLGFKQLEFAKKLNIDSKTLRQNEKDKHTVKLEVLEKLVKEYNINPLFFFFDDVNIFVNIEEQTNITPEQTIRNLFDLSKEETELSLKFINLVKNKEFREFFKDL